MSESGGNPEWGKGPYRVLSGTCPDQACGAKLFFPAYDASVECTDCGQRHQQGSLIGVESVTNPGVALHNILRNLLLGNTKPRKGADSVKVMGLSNYECKLLSPLLTKYGMDKHTGKARLLREMGQGDMFDCSLLGDRAFLLEPENINVVGYGCDRTGSQNYLKQTLECVKKANDNEERLVPIHADGDGHCLVHAISRALIGRELFWHALRENLKVHFKSRLETYKLLFRDFIADAEWNDIIDECDPYFIPPDGGALGLRNIHIFGLANVLHRPIILLDSVSGMQSSGDYTGVFLPGLLEPSQCRGKDGSLNKPLCLAWSSPGRNHYIALIGIKGRPAPQLPSWMLPKAWGIDHSNVQKYVDFDENGCCTIGGDKCLQPTYVQRLVRAMEDVFMDLYQASAALVADVHQYVFKSTGVVGAGPEVVLEETVRALQDKRLYRCLTCQAISQMAVTPEWLCPGGTLYDLAAQRHGPLNPKKNYSFQLQGLVCSYDPKKDQLIPNFQLSRLTQCHFCQGQSMRRVRGDGMVEYVNGDTTLTRSTESKCQCGFKHYWEGKEYDNLPEIFPLSLEWGGKAVKEKVAWFQYESDPTLNSNVFEVAQTLVQKHFPGEFGSERLEQKVVDTILRQTAVKENAEPAMKLITGDATSGEETDTSWREDEASKIILTGYSHKTLHKEELGKSEAERSVKARIHHQAAWQQKRRSLEQAKSASSTQSKESHKTSPVRTSPKQLKMAESQVPQSLEGSTSPSPSTSQAAMDSSTIKIRVSTSDGRQVMLMLTSETTFSALQELLAKELGVPRQQQRIKCGFPPRVLEPPAEGKDGDPVPLRHGDRVLVEVLPEVKEAGDSITVNEPPVDVWPAPKPQRHSWSGFDPSTRDQSAQELLKGLSELQEGAADSIDASIASLALMATLTGRDLWTSVQAMPHLFSVGGLFYEQMKRDLGLKDGMHCTLPHLPGKAFRYSQQHDRLELCLEPRGHFQVEPGIEEKVKQAALFLQGAQEQLKSTSQPSASSEVGAALGAGSSGVIVNKSMRFPGNQVPFSGQGHTLSGSKSENISMPSDILPSSTTHKSRMARHRLSSSERMLSRDSIDEEDENVVAMEMEGGEQESADKTEATFKRIGPGYTVLDTEKHKSARAVIPDVFQNIASHLKALAEEAEDGSETEQMTDINELNKIESQPSTSSCPSSVGTITTSPDQPGPSQMEAMDTTSVSTSRNTEAVETSSVKLEIASKTTTVISSPNQVRPSYSEDMDITSIQTSGNGDPVESPIGNLEDKNNAGKADETEAKEDTSVVKSDDTMKGEAESTLEPMSVVREVPTSLSKTGIDNQMTAKPKTYISETEASVRDKGQAEVMTVSSDPGQASITNIEQVSVVTDNVGTVNSSSNDPGLTRVEPVSNTQPSTSGAALVCQEDTMPSDTQDPGSLKVVDSNHAGKVHASDVPHNALVNPEHVPLTLNDKEALPVDITSDVTMACNEETMDAS